MAIKDWFKDFGKNTLYYPGCLTKGVLKQEFENYKEILNKLDIDFIMLPNNEFCCGKPVLNAGYKKDARELAKKNFETFKKYNINKIITNCPSCYNMFKTVYPELIRNWNIEVEHITVSILNCLKKRNIKHPEFLVREPVTYHDPCHLGRYSGIYQEPREIIELLGGKIIEMKHSGTNSLCCGAGAGISANFPDLARTIAVKRTAEIPKQAEKIISPCGLCYSNLKLATKKSEEFSTFVLRKLKEIGR